LTKKNVHSTVLAFIIVGLALIWQFIIQPLMGWFNESIINQVLGSILILIFGILLVFVGYHGLKYFLEYKKAEEQEKKNKEQKKKEKEAKYKATLFYKVSTSIKKFTPLRKHKQEYGYHTELQGWLAREFPNTKVEVQTGSSRPDIVIENIAIEIKGPTTPQDLISLQDKCSRYYQYYDRLIVVLFNPQYSKRRFEETERGIKKHFPKTELIEKSV
jgi:uncharacterized membrane protein YuzA (DUF378 family)